MKLNCAVALNIVTNSYLNFQVPFEYKPYRRVSVGINKIIRKRVSRSTHTWSRYVDLENLLLVLVKTRVRFREANDNT